MTLAGKYYVGRRIEGLPCVQGRGGWVEEANSAPGLACVCVALLLVTPGLAQPAMVRIDGMETACHIGDDLVISGNDESPRQDNDRSYFENPGTRHADIA